jgi:hypothetical protein
VEGLYSGQDPISGCCATQEEEDADEQDEEEEVNYEE